MGLKRLDGFGSDPKRKHGRRSIAQGGHAPVALRCAEQQIGLLEQWAQVMAAFFDGHGQYLSAKARGYAEFGQQVGDRFRLQRDQSDRFAGKEHGDALQRGRLQVGHETEPVGLRKAGAEAMQVGMAGQHEIGVFVVNERFRRCGFDPFGPGRAQRCDQTFGQLPGRGQTEHLRGRSMIFQE